jgi:hypothetical protein
MAASWDVAGTNLSDTIVPIRVDVQRAEMRKGKCQSTIVHQGKPFILDLFKVFFGLNRFMLSSTNWWRRSDNASLITCHLTLPEQLSSFCFFFLSDAIAIAALNHEMRTKKTFHQNVENFLKLSIQLIKKKLYGVTLLTDFPGFHIRLKSIHELTFPDRRPAQVKFGFHFVGESKINLQEKVQNENYQKNFRQLFFFSLLSLKNFQIKLNQKFITLIKLTA